MIWVDEVKENLHCEMNEFISKEMLFIRNEKNFVNNIVSSLTDSRVNYIMIFGSEPLYSVKKVDD